MNHCLMAHVSLPLSQVEGLSTILGGVTLCYTVGGVFCITAEYRSVNTVGGVFCITAEYRSRLVMAAQIIKIFYS